MASNDDQGNPKPESSFFSELRKRKVVQVAAIYGAIAWGVTEVVVTVSEQLFLPQWISTLAVIFFVVGFPVAMFLAWIFDITPDGIRRTAVSSRRGTATIAASLVLLVAGTTGLFFLIKPGIQARDEGRPTAPPLATNSVAVMPFVNSGGKPEDSYLVEGLSDELRDQLARVGGLRIAARSSSIAATRQGLDAYSASRQLGVANLVEGNVRRQGNVLRVSVQLIEGASGLAIWSNTFERGPHEFLNVQQAIAEAVVAKVLPEAEVVVAEPATRSPTANELMLLARHYEQQVRDRQEVDEGSLLEAIRLYREAIEADPESALAHSRLAGVLVYLGDLEAAEAPMFKALALDPNLSEVHHTLGLYYFARGIPEANAAFRRAVELNPYNADALEAYAYGLWISGIEKNVPELYRRALELDPLSLSRYGSLGEILAKQGRVEDTLELIQRVEELFDGADSLRLVSLLYELTGQVDRSIAWAIRARDLEPGNADHRGWLAELYVEIGDFETAQELEPSPGIGLLYKMRRYEALIDMAELLMIEDPQNFMVRYLLAFSYNATGRYESAIWILRASGLPDSVMELPRMGADYEAYLTLMNASLGAGETGVARGLAEWFVNRPDHHQNRFWFVHTLMACALGVLGRDAEAFEQLDQVRRSPGLAPVPLLRDSLCFKNYANEPSYRATVEHFDARRAALRERLPATLAEFGVSL